MAAQATIRLGDHSEFNDSALGDLDATYKLYFSDSLVCQDNAKVQSLFFNKNLHSRGAR
jgi:hypothetical protein